MYIKPLMPTGLAVNVKIMPEFFQDEGYTTHAIGKWHLGFCHQNYTPTYRGFDSFYGFYLGAEDYYTHNKYITYETYFKNSTKKGVSNGYDFRFNEQILKGPEVIGKYSADLFVNRAKAVFEEHKALEDAGKGKPWFTYLSFQVIFFVISILNLVYLPILPERSRPPPGAPHLQAECLSVQRYLKVLLLCHGELPRPLDGPGGPGLEVQQHVRQHHYRLHH